MIKKNGDGDAPKKAPFLPIVNKWCIYNEKDLTGAQVKRFGSPYDHVEATEKTQTRQIKDAEGKVITKPKEITSVPVRFGKFNSTYGHTINRFPAYEPETDTGRDKRTKEERDKWNDLYKNKRGKYFKSNCYPRAVLNPDKDVYHIEGTVTKEVTSEITFLPLASESDPQEWRRGREKTCLQTEQSRQTWNHGQHRTIS